MVRNNKDVQTFLTLFFSKWYPLVFFFYIFKSLYDMILFEYVMYAQLKFERVVFDKMYWIFK